MAATGVHTAFTLQQACKYYDLATCLTNGCDIQWHNCVALMQMAEC